MSLTSFLRGFFSRALAGLWPWRLGHLVPGVEAAWRALAWVGWRGFGSLWGTLGATVLVLCCFAPCAVAGTGSGRPTTRPGAGCVRGSVSGVVSPGPEAVREEGGGGARGRWRGIDCGGRQGWVGRVEEGTRGGLVGVGDPEGRRSFAPALGSGLFRASFGGSWLGKCEWRGWGGSGEKRPSRQQMFEEQVARNGRRIAKKKKKGCEKAGRCLWAVGEGRARCSFIRPQGDHVACGKRTRKEHKQAITLTNFNFFFFHRILPLLSASTKMAW